MSYRQDRANDLACSKSPSLVKLDAYDFEFRLGYECEGIGIQVDSNASTRT